MSRIQDDALIAYVDGELDADWKAEVERAMAADPAMAEKAARHRALREAAGRAFGEVLTEPVPERLLRAAGAAPEPAAAPAAPGVVIEAPFDPRRRRPGFGLPQWAAMAACLAIGVFAGKLFLADRPAGAPGSVVGGPGPLAADAAGKLEARGPLLRALNTQLSAEEGDGKVRLGFSFKTADGAYCRTFQMTETSLAGLACREGGRWAVRMTTPAHVDAHEDQTYRMAATPMPPSVLVTVDAMIDGAPLDRAAEESARGRDWKD